MGKITRGNISIIIKSWCGRGHTYQVTEETRRHNENEFGRELGMQKYRIRTECWEESLTFTAYFVMFVE